MMRHSGNVAPRHGRRPSVARSVPRRPAAPGLVAASDPDGVNHTSCALWRRTPYPQVIVVSTLVPIWGEVPRRRSGAARRRRDVMSLPARPAAVNGRPSGTRRAHRWFVNDFDKRAGADVVAVELRP